MNYSLKKGGDSMATADEIRRGVARGIGRPSPGLERLTKLLPEWIGAGKPLIANRLALATGCHRNSVRRYLVRNGYTPLDVRRPSTPRVADAVARFRAEGRDLVLADLARESGAHRKTVESYLLRNGLTRDDARRERLVDGVFVPSTCDADCERQDLSLKSSHDDELRAIAAERLAAQADPGPRQRDGLARQVRSALRRERRRPRWGEALAEILERDPDLPAELAAVAEARAAGKVRRDRLYIRAEAVAAFWRERGGAA